MPRTSLLLRLLTLSRPRFWLYTLGPFVLPIFAQFPGIALEWPLLLVGFIYFSFPANLLIYGVNDLFDQETDALNPKKDAYEARLQKKDIFPLLYTIFFTNVPFLVALATLAPRTIPALLGFLFFSVFYSAPPIRAKAIPFLDGIFNILYVLPALVAILIFPYTQIDWLLVLAGTLWCMAMHAFSAVPDIEADKEAGLNTAATILGHKGTLLYCTILWTMSATLPMFENPWLGYAALALLPLYLLLLLLSAKPARTFTMYRLFPVLNMFAGMMLALSLLGYLFEGPAI